MIAQGLVRRRGDRARQLRQRTALIAQPAPVAQPSAEGLTEHTSYTHLIKGDLAPVGRVHLVTMRDAGDQESQHILAEMDADSNMGAHKLAERSRKGPFKHSTGRSRVMAQSRNVTYNRRGHRLEITIRRSVTEHEMDTLIGKLSAHRLASLDCHLFLIASSKKKMDSLDRIDMEKLRKKIYDLLTKRATIGLLLVDVVQKGLLHKGFSHSSGFQKKIKRVFGGPLFK